jgi:CHAT domain-containing protein/Flp pilus assembly protein TadD
MKLMGDLELSQAKEYLNSGQQNLDSGNYLIALFCFEQAITLNPKLTEALEGKATTLRKLGRHEEAIAASEEAIALRMYVVGNNARFWFDQGILQFESGNFEGAITSFEKTTKIQPDFHDAWHNRGVALTKLELYEDAISSFDNAIKLKRNHGDAWYNRGSTLLNLERYEDAIISFDNAIKLKSDDHGSWHNRGIALTKLELYEDAIVSFDNAIEFKLDNHKVWHNRGTTLTNLERYEDAIISFDNAIKFRPDHEVSWYCRGVALTSLERYEDAIISFDKAIILDLDYHAPWHNRGIALTNLERHEDAIISFDKAIKLKPNVYEAWGNRGVTLINLERYEDAIKNYEKGLTYILQEIQPEGWGQLHRGQGDTYRYRAQRTSNNQADKLQYYMQALNCYQTALQTLEIFPKAYLELIQSFIKIYLCLANPDTADQWRIQGLEVFRQLLNAQSSMQQKRRIEAQFSGFSRVAVDALVGAGNFTVALEAAERNKNRSLNWILDEWKEKVTSPSYAEMREPLNSDREIIYWHLSEETLTTFILTPNQENPIVLTQKSTDFETWRKDWDKRYGDYRSKGKNQAQHQAHHPWRDTLKTELDRLKAILDIEKIEAYLSPHTHLILIPHRDLHRFPIHALFGDDRITTYLPSIKVGLAQKPPSTPPTSFLLNVEDPNRSDQPPLQFARLESAIIQAMFAPNVKAIGSDNGDRATVETALQEHHGIFHFTGHGDYDGRQPEHSAIGLTGTDRLTAKEINALNLQQYELVCLSACETALTGRQTIKTEYVGLTSAFLQAGVSNIISTLWTVQEVSNAYLMIRFYQFLQDEMNTAEALKRSQSWLSTVTSFELADWLIETISLKSLDPLIKQELEQQAFSLREEANASTIDLHHPPYADPYHWAAFTLTGRGFL